MEIDLTQRTISIAYEIQFEICREISMEFFSKEVKSENTIVEPRNERKK